MATMQKPYEATARRDFRPTAFKLSRHNVGKYNQAIKKKKKDKTSEPSDTMHSSGETGSNQRSEHV